MSFDPETVEIANKQLVAAMGPNIGVMVPARSMATEDAVVHAAWLVAIAMCNGVTKEQFGRVLERVLNT